MNLQDFMYPSTFLLVENNAQWELDVRMKNRYLAIACLSMIPLSLGEAPVAAQERPIAPSVRAIVNSNQDGDITPDTALTLREAIQLVNGTLTADQLSQAEQAQVTVLGANQPSQIAFDLPAGQTTIQLQSLLPALDRPGLVIDGTTQSGYDADSSATAEIAIPVPVVAIAPAPGQEIFRGLTVVADGVTVRGLSLYGFTSQHRATASTPPADIFIAHRLPPPDITQQQPPATEFPFDPRSVPPKDVVIELNWLGITPEEAVPPTTSAFGVSVFNSQGATIRRNRIANHEGSGIITSVRAENLQVTENILVGNGIAGMPDAIRLEGVVNNTQITGNLICGNDGSGVYLFKPEGAVQIRDNTITFNSRRLQRAAIYLMGNDHQVLNNQISHQFGPGVVVTAYPPSRRNQIQTNRFAALDGLSTDLVFQHNASVQAYQIGDGPNPLRRSANRRQDTGNAAINAPQLVSVREGTAGQIEVQGTADPGSQVEIYRVSEATSAYGPLSEPLATVETDAQGQFRLTLTDLQPGDQVSAIASHPEYGTSEPARNVAVAPVQAGTLRQSSAQPGVPRCTTRPQPPAPVEPPPVEPPPEPLQLQVPRNIHFALDEATISPASARVLDQIATVLQDNPTITVELQGHTDPRASDAYNLDLANRRAIAARNYLLRRGIAPERMSIRSFGKRQLRVPGSDRLDHARNRRVEFVFQDARGLELIIQETDLQLEPVR